MLKLSEISRKKICEKNFAKILHFGEYAFCNLGKIIFLMNFCKNLAFLLIIPKFFREIFASFFRKILRKKTKSFAFFCEWTKCQKMRKFSRHDFPFFPGILFPPLEKYSFDFNQFIIQSKKHPHFLILNTN